jgi:oligopeptide/dipeptide ABC transporter ATP-binding protein
MASAANLSPAPPVTAPSDPRPLVEARNLVKNFPQEATAWGRSSGVVRAVQDVNFTIDAGETLGLVGESGSGKSTTGRLILRLIDATSGSCRYAGVEVFALNPSDMRDLRRKMQIVFQDPYGAFNPRMTVGRIIGEALELRGLRAARERDDEVQRLLELVHLQPDVRNRYPHEFSGGQRQRIGIARALAVEPEFLVADEPVSALDVSTQAEIVNLLLELQQRLGLTMLFISHDLSVVRILADRIAVMYSGRIVELAPSASLFEKPLHPYTKELLSAIPEADPARAHREVRPRLDEFQKTNAGSDIGCPYAGRCPLTMPICWQEMPAMRDYAAAVGQDAGHDAACHAVEQQMASNTA